MMRLRRASAIAALSLLTSAATDRSPFLRGERRIMKRLVLALTVTLAACAPTQPSYPTLIFKGDPTSFKKAEWECKRDVVAMNYYSVALARASYVECMEAKGYIRVSQ